MAHPQQVSFLNLVKQKFPEKFKNCNVVDIGSLDINGNTRFLFEDFEYTGVDIGEGPNVDVVSKGHEFKSEKIFLFGFSSGKVTSAPLGAASKISSKLISKVSTLLFTVSVFVLIIFVGFNINIHLYIYNIRIIFLIKLIIF